MAYYADSKHEVTEELILLKIEYLTDLEPYHYQLRKIHRIQNWNL